MKTIEKIHYKIFLYRFIYIFTYCFVAYALAINNNDAINKLDNNFVIRRIDVIYLLNQRYNRSYETHYN